MIKRLRGGWGAGLIFAEECPARWRAEVRKPAVPPKTILWYCGGGVNYAVFCGGGQLKRLMASSGRPCMMSVQASAVFFSRG